MVAGKVLLIVLLSLSLTTGAVSPSKPAPAGPTSIRLAFVGDLMAHEVNLDQRNYRIAYSAVADILSAPDLVFANMEFVVDPGLERAGYPRFNAPKEYLEAALDAGVDVLSVANNHTADYGASGIAATVAVLSDLKRNRRIYYSGVAENPERRFVPEIIEMGGLDIGFLAVTAFSNEPQGTANLNIADYRIASHRENLLSVIRSVRSGVDVFILSYHGGVEYATVPDERKVLFFRELAAAGVDILWAHHPHVLQTWEILRVAGRDALIMYSLGNFLSGQPYYLDLRFPEARRSDTGESAIFFVDILNEDGAYGGMRVRAVPIVNYPHPEYGVVVATVDQIDSMTLPSDWRNFYELRKPAHTAKLHVTFPVGLDE